MAVDFLSPMVQLQLRTAGSERVFGYSSEMRHP